jgi:hypothetical protein
MLNILLSFDEWFFSFWGFTRDSFVFIDGKGIQEIFAEMS